MSNLSSVQFKYSYIPHEDMHVVAAYLPNSEESVGSMGWVGHDYAEKHGVKPGTIKNISVDEPHRRKGIGTGLFKHAKKFSESSEGSIPNPKHNSRLTPEGKAWKKALTKPRD